MTFAEEAALGLIVPLMVIQHLSNGGVAVKGGDTLKYRDGDGNICGDFIISDVLHIVAGKGQAPHTSDKARVQLNGCVLCRTSFVDDLKSNPWLELPLLRPAFKPRSTTSVRPAVRAVHWATRAEDRKHAPRLDTLKLHTAPYPLPSLKMKDIHHLLGLLCPTGAMPGTGR